MPDKTKYARERMENCTVIRLTDAVGFPKGYFVKHPSGKWYRVDIDEKTWTVTGNYGEVTDDFVANTMLEFKQKGGVDTLDEEIYDPTMHGLLTYAESKAFKKYPTTGYKMDKNFRVADAPSFKKVQSGDYSTTERFHGKRTRAPKKNLADTFDKNFRKML